MLVGMDTGYEGKFDFPPRSEPPLKTYMLASVPRTGSTYLSHLLWRTGCLGAPLEYLNFDVAGPYFFAADSAENQAWLWNSVVRRRTSPNGVFGAKCFPSQLQQLEERNPTLLRQVMDLTLNGSGGRANVVLLNRRDRAAHAISYARAILSGVWRKEQEGQTGTVVDYSQKAVDRARQTLDAQESAWTAMFAELGIEPLVLWYEDVTADPDAAVRQVAERLGVVIDPGTRIAIPEVQRQSEADSRAWNERYAAKEQSAASD